MSRKFDWKTSKIDWTPSQNIMSQNFEKTSKEVRRLSLFPNIPECKYINVIKHNSGGTLYDKLSSYCSNPRDCLSFQFPRVWYRLNRKEGKDSYCIRSLSNFLFPFVWVEDGLQWFVAVLFVQVVTFY